MADDTGDDRFEQWCILELMGHRRLAGLVSETEIAGASFLRIDVPAPDDGNPNEWAATQLYAPAAVYCITPVSEEVARQVAASAQPAPVHRWELPSPAQDMDYDR